MEVPGRGATPGAALKLDTPAHFMIGQQGFFSSLNNVLLVYFLKLLPLFFPSQHPPHVSSHWFNHWIRLHGLLSLLVKAKKETKKLHVGNKEFALHLIGFITHKGFKRKRKKTCMALPLPQFGILQFGVLFHSGRKIFHICLFLVPG